MLTDTSQQPPHLFLDSHRSIKSIRVRGLFGRFDYDIPALDANADISRLCILYGDNGAGKTTVLSLLFRLLSPAESAGHKTYVARTPFLEFGVRFSDESYILAKRSIAGAGPYSVTVNVHGNTETLSIPVDSEGKVAPADNPEVQKFFGYLRQLNLRMFFLSDSRRFRDDFIQSADPRLQLFERARRTKEVINVDGEWHYLDSRLTDDAATVGLSIERATLVIKNSLLAATAQSQLSTEAIYRDIVSTLTSPSSHQLQADAKDSFVKQLTDLHNRSQQFTTFGLAPSLVSPALIRLVETTDDSRFLQVFPVLRPYADAIAARLNAMEQAKDIAVGLVESLNGFFTDKVASFNIEDGLKVSLKNFNEPLDPNRLSSGERQLLILLCTAVHVRQPGSIFLIDEPELSLNIKWQRRLVPALLRCTDGAPVQFIVATHAIPMLAPYLPRVTRLGKVDDSEDFREGR